MLLEYIFLHFEPTCSVYEFGIFMYRPICPTRSRAGHGLAGRDVDRLGKPVVKALGHLVVLEQKRSPGQVTAACRHRATREGAVAALYSPILLCSEACNGQLASHGHAQDMELCENQSPIRARIIDAPASRRLVLQLSTNAPLVVAGSTSF